VIKSLRGELWINSSFLIITSFTSRVSISKEESFLPFLSSSLQPKRIMCNFLPRVKKIWQKNSHVVKPHGKSSFFTQNMASRKTRIMWPSSLCKPFLLLPHTS
jgi:hypothetical protein